MTNINNTNAPNPNERIERRLNHYHKIIPLKQYAPLLRLDSIPFIIIYVILILIDSGTVHITASASHNEFIQKWTHLIIFPMVLFSHVALFFAGQWNISIEAKVGYKRASLDDVNSWTHCLVIPPGTESHESKSGSSGVQTKTKTVRNASTDGRTEIVEVDIRSLKGDQTVATISYEEIIFRCCTHGSGGNSIKPGIDQEMDSIWDATLSAKTTKKSKSSSPPSSVKMDRNLSVPAAKTADTAIASTTVDSNTNMNESSRFHRLHYPVDLPLSFYLKQWTGHSKKSLKEARRVYSDNKLIVNLPPFGDLLKQQLLAPFFLFQLFCVLLWCLDEYWYYALFTLFTLVLFECTVAYTRLQNLQRLRETLRPPFKVWALREGVWELISSRALTAGDVISLSSSSMYSPESAEGTHVPCDLLLMSGSAVLNEAMLTGESVPQMKESIDIVASALSSENDGVEPVLDIEDATFKKAILFGGTVLVNHSNSNTGDGDDSQAQSVASKIPASPDDGCLALVLRTGFDTQQGSLLRTMVHTSTKSQSDGVNTKDTFMFIVILLCCAVVSSGYVLHHGWHDSNRNRFKLILHVIIIITSVVPPELPMELSLAVTSSLSDLIRRCAVYCTEPFRIPLAGMVDTCCFDKTGTLTSDEMVLRGVRLPVSVNSVLEMSTDLAKPSHEGTTDNALQIPNETLRVMVGCQSLSQGSMKTSNGSSVIGDPLEKAVLDGCGWTLLSKDTVAPPEPLKNSEWIKILHRFSFTSKLKRMTAIVQNLGSNDLYALSKGAPETLKEYLDPSSVPDSYDSISQYHMSLGQRVLAMGYRKLGGKNLSTWKKCGRKEVECNLTFAGFIVLDCPLKPDTKKVIKELRKSGHDTVMITGDAILTAAEVARQVGIIKVKAKAETYELRQIDYPQSSLQDAQSGSKFAFVPTKGVDVTNLDTEKCIAYTASNLKVLKSMLENSSIAAVCVTGDTLTKIATDAVRKKMDSKDSYIDPKTVLLHPDAQSTLINLVPLISVFARHAPRQKEAVIAAFNGSGRITLMCGDGTNDVGALKMSHCGISIISVPDVEAKQRDAMDGLIQAQDQKKKKKKTKNKKTWEDHMQALAEAEQELSSVALGDASVASPFTSRATSIRCTKDVLQRGRCTLVTMNQIYKILGVNCLVNALVLSSLHLIGAKQGDTQLTVIGIVVAGLFFFITKGEPLSKLSHHRPPSSVLCKQVLCSIAIQFFIHFACIMAVTGLSKFYLDPYDPSLVPDGAFNPNTLNSATFIMTVLATVNTFAVNYRGRPYMQDLRENKMMMKSLQICYVMLFACALEVFPPMNDLIQLAPFPAHGETIVVDTSGEVVYKWLILAAESIGFKLTLCSLMIIDTTFSILCEKALINFFEPNLL